MMRINQNSFFLYFLYFIFLFPTFPAFTRTSGGRLGDIVMVLIALSLIVMYFLFFRNTIHKGHFFNAMFLFCVFLILIELSIFFELDVLSIRDLFEFHKPVYILAVFLLFSSIKWDAGKIEDYIIKPYRYVFVFMIIYALVETFTGQFGTFLSTLVYKNDRAILYGKATGSFGITYFFAVFMIFSAFFFFFSYLFKGRKRDAILFVLSLVCVLASQSRTMLIALVVAFFYLLAVYWTFRDFPKKTAIYITFFSVFILGIILFNPVLEWAEKTYPYLYLGISALIEKGGVSATGGGSANIRYQQLLWVVENQSEIPILGAGIGKATGPQLESFYALYLYRYGLLGVLFYVIIWILTLVTSIKAYRKAIQEKAYDLAAFGLALSIFCIILPVSSLSSVITDQPRFVVLYYGSLGMLLSYLKNYSQNEKSDSSPSY